LKFKTDFRLKLGGCRREVEV